MNEENKIQNNNPTNGKEEIKAAKVYKLTAETTPEKIPEREAKPWEKPKEEKPQEEVVVQQPIVIEKKVSSGSTLTKILLIVVILMAAYIGYNYLNTMNIINRINALTSPVSTLNEEKELDLDSPIVLDLYSKVKTNIREDIAESELNNSLKLYLAFRQIPHDKLYESNCLGFDAAAMLPFACDNSTKTLPNAFKKESLLVEYVKLFGESSDFQYENIQIGRNCIGGYQYIESRGEYVQGFCTERVTTTYNVTKKLIKATSKESIITLEEDVDYGSSEGKTLPETLKSGKYIYTFKLDKNYNYIYVSKQLKEESK